MKAPLYSVLKIIVISIIGCLNHFMYEWTGNNFLIGLFTPVNESIWEHLKLLYFPYLLYCMAEWAVYGRHIGGFLFSRWAGVLCGLISIPVLFLIYTSITGKPIVCIDILIFFISVALSFWVSLKRILTNKDQHRKNSIGMILLFMPAAVFAIVTLYSYGAI